MRNPWKVPSHSERVQLLVRVDGPPQRHKSFVVCLFLKGDQPNEGTPGRMKPYQFAADWSRWIPLSYDCARLTDDFLAFSRLFARFPHDQIRESKV
jgi:hypothetical protein